jgi:peptidase E
MAAEGDRHIVAMGGITLPQRHTPRLAALVAYALGLAGVARPHVCFLDTAGGDAPRRYIGMYPKLAQHGAIASHLQLFTMPNVRDPRALLLSQDVIFVGGGSLVNMLAVWKAHGIGEILREAWAAGIVLAGVSAGAMCWFEASSTDSLGLPLRPLHGGLGLLPGSFTPHYSSEPHRRPAFRQQIAEGSLPAGLACDDGAAAHYVGTELAGIVADRRGATGYLVWPDGRGGAAEQALPAQLLSQPRSWPGVRSVRWASGCLYGYRRYHRASAALVRAAEADQPAG